MSENGSKDISITRDLVIDKIDAMHEAIIRDMPKDIDPGLRAYQVDVMSCLRDALYAMPIPDELTATIYGRKNILKEVYLFWVDEAARGDEVVDKVGLACACAKNWLADVRAEHRKSLLDERITTELAAFIEGEKRKTPKEIIADAWKIACFYDLRVAIENEDLTAQNVDALLTLERPLYSIYDEVLSNDMSDYMNNLVETALEVAQLQHESILDGHIHGNAQTEQDIKSYLALYGGLENENSQDADAEMQEYTTEKDMELEP